MNTTSFVPHGDKTVKAITNGIRLSTKIDLNNEVTTEQAAHINELLKAAQTNGVTHAVVSDNDKSLSVTLTL